jgi:hypothetical protein
MASGPGAIAFAMRWAVSMALLDLRQGLDEFAANHHVAR